MQRIRYGLIVLLIVMGLATSASAQLSIGIGFPNVSIGINLPIFPHLVAVPGYPVYYAPEVNANYFFYDGMYWVYQDDNWYASSWYDGPWGYVEPEFVPLFILRIPVRYYRQPPMYFRGWYPNAPPRWGQYWGRDWEQRRRGWDRWQRNSVPPPAPLPVYQRHYTGDRYPRRVEQQQTLRSQNYRYQPRDTVVRQHYQQQSGQKAPAPAPAPRVRQENAPTRSPGQQDIQRSTPHQQGGQRTTAPPRVRQGNAPARNSGQQDIQRPTPHQQGGQTGSRSQPSQQTPPQQRGSAVKNLNQQPGSAQRVQQAPRQQEQERKSQERGKSQNPRHGQEQYEDQERGQGRNN